MNDKTKGFFQGGGKQKPHQGKQRKDFRKKVEYNIKFREEEGGPLRRDLLIKDAKGYSENMDIGRVSFTQLRSFFNYVLSVKERLITGKKSYEEIEHEVAMLVSKANYKRTRDAKNTELFKFIEAGVNRIHKKQDVLDFALLFEAVVGFFPRKK